MDEAAYISRSDFAALVREFIQRLQDNDSQQVLAHAILLDLTLEADNAGRVLGLDESGLRAVGEGIRASYRAYRLGNQSEAIDFAAGVLPSLLGDKDAVAEAAPCATTTLSLLRAPDGNYWIRVLDEQLSPRATQESAARTLGPLRRNKVFHQLMLLGLNDRQADAFLERADIEKTAEIHGITEPGG